MPSRRSRVRHVGLSTCLTSLRDESNFRHLRGLKATTKRTSPLWGVRLKLFEISKLLTQKLILGLDIGTSSVRAALYDLNGEMLPSTLVKKGNELLVVNTQFDTKDKQPPKQPFTVAVIPIAKLEGG